MLQHFKHLESNPEILNGKPILKGTRISVAQVLEWLASGASVQEIEAAYPQVKAVAVQEALGYASMAMQNERVTEIPTPGTA